MPPSRPLAVAVQVGQSDSDPNQLDALTRQLFSELGELDIESVQLMPGAAESPGTKSADAITLGALAIAVLPGFLPKVVEYLQAWSMRGEGRTVKLKVQRGNRSLELDCPTTSVAELEPLVRQFMLDAGHK